MAGLGGGNKARQVVFDVSARAEEQRHDSDGLRAGGSERGHGFAERRAHQLEVRNPDEKLLRKF